MKIINTGYKHEPEVFAVTILIFNEEGQNPNCLKKE